MAAQFFVHQRGIFPCIGHLQFIGHPLETDVAVVCQSWRAFSAAFGSDQHYAVGCPHTVYGRAGGIFQYLHRLNIRRVKEIKIWYKHTIHDVEGLHPALRRTYAPNTYLRRGSRHACVRDLYAGYLPLQVTHRVLRRLPGYLLPFHRSDRTCHISFLLGTITCHHYLLQLFRRVKEIKIWYKHTIHDVEGLHPALRRTYAPNTYLRRGSRHACVRDLYAGYLPLQVTHRVLRRLPGYLLPFHRSDRTCHISFLLGTITCHHYLLQLFRRWF